MKTLKTLKLMIIAMTISGVWASAAMASDSDAAVLFLLISPGSRPAGMGESFVATADDATAAWWNSAGLGFQRNNQIMGMYSDWLPSFGFNDMYYVYLGGAHYLNMMGGTLGWNAIYLNMGEQAYTDENGNNLGTINSYDMALSLAYGTQLSPDLAVGAAGRFIYSDLASGTDVGQQTAKPGKSAALDLGILYKKPLNDKFQVSLGASATNMGMKIFYADEAQADPLPTNLKMGYSVDFRLDPRNTWKVLTMDMNKPMRDRTEGAFKGMFTSWFKHGPKAEFESWTYNMGSEWWYGTDIGRMGTAAFGVRAGYLVDVEGEIRAATFGASLKMAMFALDLAYENAGKAHPLTDTMRFTVAMEW